MLRRVVDAVLETSVVGSFTKVGYEARRRMYDWPDLASFDMSGKCELICRTGPVAQDVPRCSFADVGLMG